ncbi:hypothetical protein BUB20358_06800 [Burkholderia ubonensis]|nr:hypothetical protein BUB20358_06800 [Burkholderia ubonensis]
MEERHRQGRARRVADGAALRDQSGLGCGADGPHPKEQRIPVLGAVDRGSRAARDRSAAQAVRSARRDRRVARRIRPQHGADARRGVRRCGAGRQPAVHGRADHRGDQGAARAQGAVACRAGHAGHDAGAAPETRRASRFDAEGCAAELAAGEGRLRVPAHREREAGQLRDGRREPRADGLRARRDRADRVDTALPVEPRGVRRESARCTLEQPVSLVAGRTGRRADVLRSRQPGGAAAAGGRGRIGRGADRAIHRHASG